MPKYFYDRKDNCIVSTEKAFEFYNKYWFEEYKNFEEYLNIVYSDFVWITNYKEGALNNAL